MMQMSYIWVRMIVKRATDQQVWNEFQQGIFCVNKDRIPLCSNHAIEHVQTTLSMNMMKVKGRLRGDAAGNNEQTVPAAINGWVV